MTTEELAREQILAMAEHIKEEYEQAKKHMEKVTRDAFSNGSRLIFEAFPNVEYFGWHQYTPYWNDGDECVFRAGTEEDEIHIGFNNPNPAPFVAESEDEDEEEEYDDYDESNGFYEVSERGPNGRRALLGEEDKFNAYQTIASFLSVFEEDALTTMFDNHVRVTISRNKDGGNPVVETESYEHE